MRELVLAMAALLGHPHPPAAIVAAVVAAAETPLEAAELLVWGVHESGLDEHPAAWSWDAKAGVSCGWLQLRCALHGSAEHDARVWLGLVRAHGTAGVTGSSRLARLREGEASTVLARAGAVGAVSPTR